ncbi:F-box incomplete domain containing protein [Pandoravirus dulcis]|uniref:F-box incomplete domain containing protein n=1 Tax=Pandoravirus dulcis TaxID=1349409 RepID=S4VXE2_9VIRU|nr:F-box incomplete domain containing protein [Pandoravirus dulcis]AGO82746.1 F-box incomplete domain containing protein [Pandoravirus dulcis]
MAQRNRGNNSTLLRINKETYLRRRSHRQRESARAHKERKRADKTREKMAEVVCEERAEERAYIDPELWGIILADPVVGLDPAYRCMARRVCRQWRDLIDQAAPTDRGWREPTARRLTRKPIYNIATMLPWSRGRILAASVLVECYGLRAIDATARGTDRASGLTVKDYERVFAAVACNVAPVDQCGVMMLSLDPAIVDLGIRIAKEGVEPFMAALAIESALRSGRAWILDRVCEAWPEGAQSLSHAYMPLEAIDVDMFDRLLHHAPNIPIFEIGDLRADVARHIADVFCGRVDRPWSTQWTRDADDPDDREYNLSSLIAEDNDVLLRALDDAGLYDLSDDVAVDEVCRRRAIKTAAWLIERARHGSEDALARMVDKMLRGALTRSHDSDGFPCSSHPEALLSWLLGGPTPPYDPLAPGAPLSLMSLFRLASASDFSCEVPRCLFWLCLRWPQEASAHLGAVCDAARQMLTRNGKWIDSYLCRDGRTLEYLVYMLDALYTKLTRVGHAHSARDLLRAVDLYAITIECTCDPQTRAAFVEHGRARCADDDSVPTRLALMRAYVLRTIDPMAVDPWRATFASAAAWRRWFRVPDTDDACMP